MLRNIVDNGLRAIAPNQGCILLSVRGFHVQIYYIIFFFVIFLIKTDAATVSLSIPGILNVAKSAPVNKPGGFTLRLKSTASGNAVADTSAEACIKVSGSVYIGTFSEFSFPASWSLVLPYAYVDMHLGYSLGLVNQCGYELKRYLALWNTKNNAVWIGDWVTVPATRSCSFTFPDTVDLGSFTAEQIKNSAASSSKINLTGQCDMPFSVNFTGNASGNGNFRLGDDVEMRLSYNYGANQIINGQSFTPAASQIIDVYLFPVSTGAAPNAGIKTTTLTASISIL